MRAYVEYMMPVLALVDTEKDEVVRVVQVAEEIRPTKLVFSSEGDDEPGAELSMVASAAALVLAENREWPEWDCGF